MNSARAHSANVRITLKLLGLIAILLFFSHSSFGQNTKGDRAEVGTNNQRQTRFKTKKPKRNKAKPSGRITPRKFSVANIARSLNRPPKNVYSQHDRRFVNNQHQKPSNEQGATRDNSARPKRRKPIDNQRARRDASSNSRRVVRSPSDRSHNVYSRYETYSSNPSRKPKNFQPSVSNNATLARVNRFGSPKPPPPGKKKKITPRTASSSFIRHKTINANAGFWNVKKKSEVAVTTDIAGRPLRTRNYHTPPHEVIKPTNRHYSKNKRIGDRPYQGSGAGGYVTATRPSAKAWQGDISGRKIRGRNFTSKSHVEGNVSAPRKRLKAHNGDRVYRGIIPGKGNKSATQSAKKGQGMLQGKAPGIGANGIGTFQGNLKGNRPLKGGGSKSGKLWNNGEAAILGRQPRSTAYQVGTFQGNLKGNRPLKGGGSRSGRLWNNGETAILGRQPKSTAYQIGSFQGNLKGNRPLKGGGSRSGRLWNNSETAILGRQPKSGAYQAGTFQGNIKSYKPLKGGGSISGRPRNNNGVPIQGKQPGLAAQGDWTFHGNLKSRRPLKGGGSVSGRLWNNKTSPIIVRTPPSRAAQIGGFPGKLKRFEQSPGFSDQGEEFTGYKKATKPLKGGGSVSGKLWNNKTTPIQVRTPPSRAAEIGGFPGKIKRFELSPGFSDQGEEFTGYTKLPRFKKAYIKNDNAVDESMKKRRPSETSYRVSDLQVRVKRRDYIENKNSAKEALLKLEPTKTTLATGDLQVKVKRYNYIHNSSSSEEALNVREPGKAFAKATDYQGNIKMKRVDFNKLFSQRYHELHPDAKFVKINKNNVADERDLVTNIKLWWARKFKKNDTQPDHLKEKERKPRYDKGEQGLWNE